MKRPERCAYSYARVKATMTLRTSGHQRATSGLRHRRFSLLVTLAGAAVALLLLASGSGAGGAEYTGTLYLAGPVGVVNGNYQLVTTTPPATPAQDPVASLGGSGTVPAGTYQYVYVVSSGSARTESAISNTITLPAAGSVSVANVPI